MRAIKEIEADIAGIKSKISEADNIGNMMSCVGSGDFIKLIKGVRDAAIQSMASLDPHLPSLAIEYAGHRRVKDTMSSLLTALTGYHDVLNKYRSRLLELNGELTEGIKIRKEKERNRI